MIEAPKGKREGRRVLLSNKALKGVNQISSELKEAHCKLTHSSLVSKIVEVFFDRYYKREKTKLEKEFFDQKAYLKSVLSGAVSEEEISASVKKFLKKVGGNNAKKSL